MDVDETSCDSRNNDYHLSYHNYHSATSTPKAALDQQRKATVHTVNDEVLLLRQQQQRPSLLSPQPPLDDININHLLMINDAK
eukprot:6952-Amphidinium_carterae.1